MADSGDSARWAKMSTTEKKQFIDNILRMQEAWEGEQLQASGTRTSKRRSSRYASSTQLSTITELHSANIDQSFQFSGGPQVTANTLEDPFTERQHGQIDGNIQSLSLQHALGASSEHDHPPLYDPLALAPFVVRSLDRTDSTISQSSVHSSALHPRSLETQQSSTSSFEGFIPEDYITLSSSYWVPAAKTELMNHERYNSQQVPVPGTQHSGCESSVERMGQVVPPHSMNSGYPTSPLAQAVNSALVEPIASKIPEWVHNLPATRPRTHPVFTSSPATYHQYSARDQPDQGNAAAYQQPPEVRYVCREQSPASKVYPNHNAGPSTSDEADPCAPHTSYSVQTDLNRPRAYTLPILSSTKSSSPNYRGRTREVMKVYSRRSADGTTTAPENTIGPSLEAAVLKVTGFGYDVRPNDIIVVLGEEIDLIEYPRNSSNSVYAIHIIQDRIMGKTKEAYVEVPSFREANRVIQAFEGRKGRKKDVKFTNGRRAKIMLSTQSELMKALFPRAKCEWQNGQPVRTAEYVKGNDHGSFDGFITKEEMNKALLFVNQPSAIKTRCAAECPERVYTLMMSSLIKMPWDAEPRLNWFSEDWLHNWLHELLGRMSVKLAHEVRDPKIPRLDIKLLNQWMRVLMTCGFYGRKDNGSTALDTTIVQRVDSILTPLAKKQPHLFGLRQYSPLKPTASGELRSLSSSLPSYASKKSLATGIRNTQTSDNQEGAAFASVPANSLESNNMATAAVTSNLGLHNGGQDKALSTLTYPGLANDGPLTDLGNATSAVLPPQSGEKDRASCASLNEDRAEYQPSGSAHRINNASESSVNVLIPTNTTFAAITQPKVGAGGASGTNKTLSTSVNQFTHIDKAALAAVTRQRANRFTPLFADDDTDSDPDTGTC